MYRRHRLTGSADFLRVRREGNSFHNRLLVLCVLPNGEGTIRFGFATSRRVGKAVVRNRLKRLLREAARHLLKEMVPGWDMVFIARSAAVEADFHRILGAMEELAKGAGLLKGVGEKVEVDV